MQQPSGQILITGASRAGKSYYAKAFKDMGLKAIDLENDIPGSLGWYNDITGEQVQKPLDRTPEWYHQNHFLINRAKLSSLLATEKDCIIFTHAWNILDCIPLFDRTYFLYVSPDELDRRLDIERDDHGNQKSEAGKEFARKKHADRLVDIQKLGIPILDATLSPEEVYKILLQD